MASAHADNWLETYRVWCRDDSAIVVGGVHQKARPLDPPTQDSRARPVI